MFVYGEPFTRAHAIAFTAIWSALALYVTALLGAAGRDRLRDGGGEAMVR